MLTCACILPNTRCWLLSTGIWRLICSITSTRNVLNKHLLTARAGSTAWPALTEMNLGTSPGGTGGKFQQSISWMCAFTSQVWVSSGHRLLIQPGWPGAVQGRTWLQGNCRAEGFQEQKLWDIARNKLLPLGQERLLSFSLVFMSLATVQSYLTKRLVLYETCCFNSSKHENIYLMT